MHLCSFSYIILSLISDKIEIPEILDERQLARSYNAKKQAREFAGACRAQECERERELIFQVFPISLMVDMMTIERIKIFDLTGKKDLVSAVKAENKLKSLQKIIDRYIARIATEKKYNITEEARTF